MNQIIITGNVVADPMINRSFNANGEEQTIAHFRMAVNRSYKAPDGSRVTDFFDIDAFGKRAEFVEKYVQKGTALLVEGAMQDNNYQKDGQTIYRKVIRANNIEFTGAKRQESEA